MPSSPRVPRLLAALLLLLPATGCILVLPVATGGAGAATGAVTAKLPPDTSASPYAVGASVRVEFASAARRTALTAGGEPRDVGALRVATGRVAMQRNDSIWIALTEVREVDGRVRHFPRSRPPQLPVATRTDGVVRVLAIAPAVRERALVGSGLGFALGLLTVIGICARTECFQ